MTYDDSEIEIVVNVSDLGNSQLSVSAIYPNNVTFNNIYRAQGEVILRVLKELEGRDIKDQEFEFVLMDEEKTVIETVTNNALGQITFTALEFTQDDVGKEFKYVLAEVVGEEKGMTYDKTQHEITIKVVDSRDGVVDIEVIHESDLVFVNSYVIPKDGIVKAIKEWINKEDDHPTIWFKLYRQLEKQEAVEVPEAEIMKLEDGTTSVTWENLEMIDIEGNEYLFSVREVDQDGNDYVPENYEKIESGLKVVNTYIEPVKPPKLPDTRTQQNYYQFLGMAVVAGGLLILSKRKKEEE